MLCGKVEPIVNGLEKEYGSQLDFEIVDYKKGDSPERIKKYDLGVHGMVITDQAGNRIWSESGHKQTRPGIVKGIKYSLSR
ncbi:MAG: hypothetical protein VYE77_04930 [Planctomycetota bacterium]|nr:hypothetical protein [Planctomycetota bacterium]